MSVGEGALRALKDRPTNLKRHPDGVQSEAIYQKRMPAKHPDWLETVTVTFPSGRKADSLRVTEVAAIAYCANLGTIDFHPWQVRAADVEHPDELRLDLDPQPGLDFEAVRRAAFLAREVLAELGMTGFVKTSGNRGAHIAVRIEPRWDFVQVRHAGIALARAVEERDPGLVTTAWWKEERGERVFIDFNQNARDRTIASAYSVRAQPHGARLHAAHLGRAGRRRPARLRHPHRAAPLRRAGRRARRHRRPPVLHRGAARALCRGRARRHALSAQLSEDARRAQARAAEQGT